MNYIKLKVKKYKDMSNKICVLFRKGSYIFSTAVGGGEGEPVLINMEYASILNVL